MSSKKKQGVPTEKKKFSFLNLGKSKGPEKNVDKNAEISDTVGAAAGLHSNEADKPSTSGNKGQLKKITKFFKKGHNAHAKKASKKANMGMNEHPPLSENDPVGAPGVQSEMKKNDMPLSLKTDGPEVIDGELRREKAATKIQAVFRGHNQRRKYLKERQNVVKIEALARGFLARKQVASMKTSPEVRDQGKEHNLDEIQSENLITFS